MPPIPELEEIRKNQILAAAVKCLAKDGCANVTLADVAAAAGLSKGGLTHYYPSKEELFKAAFHEFFHRVFERFEHILAEVPDPRERLFSFELLFDPTEPATEIGDPDVSVVEVGYPLLYDCMYLAAHNPEYKVLFGEWVDEWIRFLKTALDDCVAAGLYGPMDTDSVARTISAIYQGVATRWFLAPAKHPARWANESCRQAIQGLLEPYANRP